MNRSDANAADTDADHDNVLNAFYTTFGDIIPTDMVVGLLDTNPRPRNSRTSDA